MQRSLISMRAAAAWPARSAMSANTTRFRGPSGKSDFSQPCARQAATPSSWPPASLAAGKSSISPAEPPCIRRSFFGRSKLQRLRPRPSDDKDFAIANAAGSGRAHDVVGDLFGALVADPDADFHFGQKRHAVLAADVAVEIALLAAITLGLA